MHYTSLAARPNQPSTGHYLAREETSFFPPSYFVVGEGSGHETSTTHVDRYGYKEPLWMVGHLYMEPNLMSLKLKQSYKHIVNTFKSRTGGRMEVRVAVEGLSVAAAAKVALEPWLVAAVKPWAAAAQGNCCYSPWVVDTGGCGLK